VRATIDTVEGAVRSIDLVVVAEQGGGTTLGLNRTSKINISATLDFEMNRVLHHQLSPTF
jgi:hypothetical protein